MLEGKEVDVKFDGDAGEFFVDVDAQGVVEVGVKYEKNVKDVVKVKLGNSVEVSFFSLAEKICAKTKTPYDDAVLKGLKNLLGIQEAVAAEAVAEAAPAPVPAAE